MIDANTPKSMYGNIHIPKIPKNMFYNQLPPNYNNWFQLYLDVKKSGALKDWHDDKIFEIHYHWPLRDETDMSFDSYKIQPSFANSMIVKETDKLLEGLNQDSFWKLKYIANGGSFSHDDERFKGIVSLFLNLELFVTKC